MKKYLLFTYYAEKPLGGVNDFLGDFDSIGEALDNILEERRRYYQIVDRDTMKCLRHGLALFKRFDPGEFRREADRPGRVSE